MRKSDGNKTSKRLSVSKYDMKVNRMREYIRCSKPDGSERREKALERFKQKPYHLSVRERKDES